MNNILNTFMVAGVKCLAYRVCFILILLTCLCCQGATVAEVSQEFFARIDLDQAELATVRSDYLAGNHTAALEGYRDVFVDRMAAIDLGSPEGFWSQGATSASMAYAGTIKMDAMGTGYCTDNIGLPGDVEWFPLVDCYIDFGRDVSSMHWTGIIVKGYMSGQSVSYLERYCDYWSDFGVNWMAQRPDNGSPYSDTLHWAWKSGLYLAWRVDNFMRFYSAACTYNPAEAKSAISGEKLANILNQLTTLEIPDLAANRYPTTPNQQILAIQALLKASAALEDFKNVGQWRDFALAKALEYVTAGSYLADGSDQEQSFNYNGGLVDSAQQMIDQINAIMPNDEQAQQVVAKLQEAKIYRSRFLEMLKSPIGSMPATGTSSMSVPDSYTANVYDDFTSIYYPYGGYTMLRSGWDRQALYAFFKSSRVGYGHYVDDGLHLTLCAYGKNLLIAGGPNSYNGEPADVYYRSSFSRNTIAVDGYGQTSHQDNEMPSNGYPDPIEANWHTSESFDLVDGSYPYGYGDKITDVTHKRLLVHSRRLGVFVVTDRLTTTQSHDYTLTWGFDSAFAANEVHYDSGQKKLYTDKSNNPNLMIQHFTKANLSAQMYHGDSANWLGWYTPIHGHDNNIAKVDSHINWSGSGSQQVVSLLCPQDDTGSEIETLVSYDNGFDLTTKSGESLAYRAELMVESLTVGNVNVIAQMLLVQDVNGEPLRGMVMGATSQRLEIDGQTKLTGCKNFEFTLDGLQLNITPIEQPEFFHWEDEAAQMHPMYDEVITPTNAQAVWWLMDSFNASELLDATGQGFDALLSGSPTWYEQGGLWGGAVEFDGVDDCAIVGGEYSPVSGNHARTVAAWVKVDQPGTLVCWGVSAPSNQWVVEITDNGTVGIDVIGGLLAGTTDLRDGKWHHVATVLPQINNGWVTDAILYVDGKRELPSVMIDYEVETASGGQVTIGMRDQSNYFAGKLDEVFIVAVELSDKQIVQLYQAGCSSINQPCSSFVIDLEFYIAGDLNYDCFIDCLDLSILADYWLRSIAPFTGDINEDGIANIEDFTVIANDWQKTPPTLWWAFTETDSVQVSDFGALGLPGQIAGSPQWTDDSPASSWAMVFDGVDDAVSIDWFDAIIGGRQRTVSLWIKTDACGTVLSWGDDSDEGQTFSLVVQEQYGTPGTLAMLAGTGYRVGKTDLRDGKWHHIAAVLPDDGSVDIWDAELYVDGVEERYSSFRSKLINTIPGSLTLAMDSQGNNRFAGSIDELRIYDKALSASAIFKLMQGL